MTNDADRAGHRRARSGLLLPRHPGDVVRVGLAVLILVAAAFLVHRDRVGVEEADVFRVVNDLPGALFPVLWPVMQLGNIVAVPVAGAVALAMRRFRLAACIVLAGGGVWLLAKLVKQLVQRGRPASLLPAVHIHGAAATGRGYLSGHAAVAFAIATLVSPYLPRPMRRLLWAVVTVVCVARVYVGAHLPLDVVAGAALGWGTASAVHLVLGAPSGRPALGSLRRALEARGFSVAALIAVDVDGRRSARFAVTTGTGERVFVKVVPRERRDVDVLYRCWLALTGRHRGSGGSGGSGRTPAQQAAHEAAMTLLAAAAGARVPRVLSAGSYGNGTGLLVTEWVEAAPMGAEPLTGDAVEDAWRQVGAMRSTRLAHRHIEPANVLVDARHRVWLVDFDRATAPAAPAHLQRDMAEMLDCLATCVKRDTAEAAAKAVLPGADDLLATARG